MLAVEAQVLKHEHFQNRHLIKSICCFSLMVASAVQIAKRALLVAMHAVAVTVGMVLSCNRDSTDAVVIPNFRKLALKAHQDRPGGSNALQQQLNDARAAWDDARKAGKAAGRPKAGKTAGRPKGSTSDDKGVLVTLMQHCLGTLS